MKGNRAEWFGFCVSAEAEGELSYFGRDDRVASSFISVHPR